MDLRPKLFQSFFEPPAAGAELRGRRVGVAQRDQVKPKIQGVDRRGNPARSGTVAPIQGNPQARVGRPSVLSSAVRFVLVARHHRLTLGGQRIGLRKLALMGELQ